MKTGEDITETLETIVEGDPDGAREDHLRDSWNISQPPTPFHPTTLVPAQRRRSPSMR